MMSYWRQKRAITAAGREGGERIGIQWRRQLSLTHLPSERACWIMEACSQGRVGGPLLAES